VMGIMAIMRRVVSPDSHVFMISIIPNITQMVANRQQKSLCSKS